MSLGRFKLPVQPFPSPLRWQPLKIVTVELLEGVQHRHLLSVAASRVQVVQADAGYPFLHICVVRDSKLGEMCCHHQLLGDDAVNDLMNSHPSAVWLPSKERHVGVHLLNLCQFCILMMAMTFNIV